MDQPDHTAVASAQEGLTQQVIRHLLSKGLSQGEISRRSKIPQPRLSRWLQHGSPVGDDALRLKELDARTKPRKPRRPPQVEAPQGNHLPADGFPSTPSHP